MGGRVENGVDTSMAGARRRSFLANFWRDVFFNPSVSPLTAWLVGGLLVLVGWLTLNYAPGAAERGGACGASAAETGPGIIPLDWGYGTLAAVAALTFIAGVQPVIGKRFSAQGGDTIANWYARQNSIVRGLAMALGSILKTLFSLLGWAFSLLDWFLARPLALLAGAGLQPWPLRYGVFLVWMALALAWAWLTPAPVGLYGFFFGVALILGVVRRWNWVERDREAFFVSRKQDPESERIGFAEDLRDEALISLIFLFLFIPLGLRQIELLHAGTFCIAGASPSDVGVLAWLGFFGAELAKSVPFVDWSEVFHVANGSPIEPNTVLGAQVVFAMRAALDLLMIAAVVQAVQLASRLAEQDEAFAAGKVDILEPFLERLRFRALGRVADMASEGDIILRKPIQAFGAYSLGRLAQIASGWTLRDAAQAADDPLARRGALALATKQAATKDRPEEAAPLLIAARKDPVEANRKLAFRLAAESNPTALMAHAYFQAREFIRDGGQVKDARELLSQYPRYTHRLAWRAIKGATGQFDAMVRLPGGPFVMGGPAGQGDDTSYDGRPTHLVEMPAFEIGRFPVLEQEFSASFEGRSSWNDSKWEQQWALTEHVPSAALGVNWLDARGYISWINSWTEGGYRLPSEAEWEYACRAGTTTRWWYGDDEAQLEEYFALNEHDGELGKKPPNPFGLHGMNSFRWEWCEDPWHGSYEGAPSDGSAWSENGDPRLRMVRGGNFGLIPRGTSAAVRHGLGPWVRTHNVAFRLARSV